MGQMANSVADTVVATKEKHAYRAGEFEGPLDLLWTLIRESKVNIYDIPIAQITEQYLEYLDYAVKTDLGDLSEFYSWASKLIYIKSRMLLPVEFNYEDETYRFRKNFYDYTNLSERYRTFPCPLL